MSNDKQNYFERDSLAALNIVLTHLPSLTALDDTIIDLRRHTPIPSASSSSPIPWRRC